MFRQSAAMPSKVLELQARLAYWNATTVGSIHVRPGDPAGNAYANASDCWTPWEGKGAHDDAFDIGGRKNAAPELTQQQ